MESQSLPEKCCATCKFYLLAEGICRRYPPAVVAEKRGWRSLFPPMTPIGWCGEFSKVGE